MDEKVDYYLNKIYEYRKHYGRQFNHNKEELQEIKEIIHHLIKKNDDYLLTDNYLDYLSSCVNFDYDLIEISGNIYQKLEMIKWYFEALDQNIIEDENDKAHYFLTLDDNLKQKVLDIHNYCDTIHSIGIFSDLVCKMVLYIYSYCYMNNRLEKVNEICDSLLNDYSRIIDDTNLNDIWDGSHEWIDRIIVFCEDHIKNKRIIK